MRFFMKRSGLLAMVTVLGLAGCATTTKDLDEVRAQVEQANALANRAAEDAAAARTQAANASRAAKAAQSEASDASSMARDAKNTAIETENKIDRMFKKAMYK